MFLSFQKTNKYLENNRRIVEYRLYKKEYEAARQAGYLTSYKLIYFLFFRLALLSLLVYKSKAKKVLYILNQYL